MAKCIGPCLPHCTNKNWALFVIIGLLIALLIYLKVREQKKIIKVI